ncbi:MAG: GDP-mannose 4,6-dehydratase [Candidatus Magasanikbacteria bacterium]
MNDSSNFLVTGGAGFIGSHVVDDLVDKDKNVVILDDFNEQYNPDYKERNIMHHLESDQVRVVEGSVCDYKLLNYLFEDEEIEFVIHLAARPGVRGSIDKPMLCTKVNVRGTNTVFEVAKEHEVQNIIFASSSSVYGNKKDTPFSEDQNVNNPISPYASTKVSGERMAHTYHHLYDMNIPCLRFFTVYGERGRPNMAPWIFTERVMEDRPIQQFGDGTSKRDYTYIGDIVDGIMRTAERMDEIGFEIMNLGRGEPVVLKDFIQMVQDISGKEAEIEVLPEQPGDVEVTHADISKAREILDYNPKTSFEQGLTNFIRWYQDKYK